MNQLTWNKKNIIKYAAGFLISAGAVILLDYLSARFISSEPLLKEWLTSILMVISTVFGGLPCVFGTAVGYGLFHIYYLETLYQMLLFFISKLPLGILAYWGSRNIKKMNNMKNFINLSACSVLGCFLSFVLYYYYFELNGVSGGNIWFRVMNYLSSNIVCIMCIAIPICALIFRIKNEKEKEENRKESVQVRTVLIFMPVFLLLFITFYLSCQPDIFYAEEYWCKVFLTAIVVILEIMTICFLLSKWKIATMVALGVFLVVLIISGIINKDPWMAIILVIVGLLYLLFRIIFYKKIESGIDKSKKLKALIVGLNIIFIGVFALQAAINGTVVVLPFSDMDEQYAIVLGAPVYDGAPSGILGERISAACSYAANNRDGIYFVTGGTKDGSANVSEADLIGGALEKEGISPSQIVYEREAKTTLENFKNILTIFNERGYDKNSKVVIISSIFHYPRATLYAFKAGFTNLTYMDTSKSFLSDFLWSIREAIVFPECLISNIS